MPGSDAEKTRKAKKAKSVADKERRDKQAAKPGRKADQRAQHDATVDAGRGRRPSLFGKAPGEDSTKTFITDKDGKKSIRVTNKKTGDVFFKDVASDGTTTRRKKQDALGFSRK